MKKGLTQEVKERIEAIEGMDVFDAAKFRYVREQRSYRWLSVKWGINGRTVGRVLSFCGIVPRVGSDAVRSQWIDNAERRKKAGECLSATNHELAMKGLHVRQGKNKQNSQLIKDLFEKRRLFGAYVADFYVPDLNLVVDCLGRNRFPLSYDRHQRMAQDGACIAYCVNEQVARGSFSDLDNYISKVKLLRTNPSFRCAETMIFGACGECPFGADSDKFTICRSGVRASYYAELSASSND